MEKTGSVEKLTWAEKWFRDGLEQCNHAGSLVSLEVDVTASAVLLNQLRDQGSPVKWSAIFVKAVAHCLERNRVLHQLMAGAQRLRPDQVDICLSVSSEQSITPVIILEDCAKRDRSSIASEIVRLTPLAQESDRQMIALLNRWGFLGFTESIRKSLVGFLLSRLRYRRKVSGTFQVSILPGVDTFAPFRFNTAAALGIGAVRNRAVVIDHSVAVRPTVILTCCFDHAVWNGGDASRFLNDVKRALEQPDFA